ncbi:cytochrome b/b6 domain-containing protein [Shewanella corallii]|uniref:Cytochrome b/b6 domain-containing protein n=1 Tax=Shewanella corallii TaxID=560080 RepID=A0ABT0N4P6_9GAMM|nr:cytochrome b/b6 domain-containing protein [Shewanella corallii]MCL2913382.1 cytochrome b/b6 domain-containing protein [Shewanella corallii]
MSASVKVWDFPTRLFHWALVALIGGLWWTADAGEMEWHMVLAYSLGALLLFRVIWGFIGSDTSRFRDFVHGPRTVIGYASSLKTRGVTPHSGHNPLGGYMVVVMLLAIAAQFTTGLFATDDVFTEGPLYAYVSSNTADWMTWVHKKNFDFILVLVGLHVLAVLVHMFKGDALLGAMFTGRRQGIAERNLQFAPLWQALVILAVIGALMGYFLIWPVYSNMY